MGQTLHCLCKGIEFTQSHWLEKAIPDSYDKCEPGFTVGVLNSFKHDHNNNVVEVESD